MSIRKITAAVLAAGVAFSPMGQLVQGATNASVKQCVWNKAGIILDIYWVHPSNFYREKVWDGKEDANGATGNTTVDGPLQLKSDAKPAASDQMPTGQGRCREFNERHYAILRISGYGHWEQFWKLVGGKGTGINDQGSIGTSYPSANRYTDVWGPVGDVKFCDDCGGQVK